MGIVEVHQGVRDKSLAVLQVRKRHGLSKEEVCYIGDDELDSPVLQAVGMSAAPNDAMPGFRKRVDYVAKAGGGRGAVRELVDLILRAQKRI